MGATHGPRDAFHLLRVSGVREALRHPIGRACDTVQGVERRFLMLCHAAQRGGGVEERVGLDLVIPTDAWVV